MRVCRSSRGGKLLALKIPFIFILAGCGSAVPSSQITAGRGPVLCPSIGNGTPLHTFATTPTSRVDALHAATWSAFAPPNAQSTAVFGPE